MLSLAATTYFNLTICFQNWSLQLQKPDFENYMVNREDLHNTSEKPV